MRPESDSPSTVVRSHDDRRASTSSESADGFVLVFASGVDGGPEAGDGVDAVVAAVDTAEGFDGTVAGAVDCAVDSVATGFLSDRSHAIVPIRIAIPATPNSPTNMCVRRDEGTGTASLGNGEDSNVRGAGVDIEGECDEDAYDVADASDDAGMCGGTAGSVLGAARSVSSANTLGSSGGGGNCGGSANAWKGTVRASSASASMSARASSSMPLTAS